MHSPNQALSTRKEMEREVGWLTRGEVEGAEGGGSDALPDGEDEVDGDGDPGRHVLIDERLVLQLLQLHEREHRLVLRARRRRAARSP